jgi:RNA-directed DNA polymerase
MSKLKTFDELSPDNKWHNIPWDKCHKIVRRLQLRIAKATEANNLRLVKQLQKLLVKSTSAKAIAVKQVSAINAGKKTSGVDKDLWNTPKKKWEGILSLRTEKISTYGFKKDLYSKS